jgi:hypothetical protein
MQHRSTHIQLWSSRFVETHVDCVARVFLSLCYLNCIAGSPVSVDLDDALRNFGQDTAEFMKEFADGKHVATMHAVLLFRC